MTLKEGWWMPGRAKKHHYFVEGRSLCGGWAFPHYPSLTVDTGNTEPLEDDCKACFKKLVKRRGGKEYV